MLHFGNFNDLVFFHPEMSTLDEQKTGVNDCEWAKCEWQESFPSHGLKMEWQQKQTAEEQRHRMRAMSSKGMH